jgi:hypothetical protein
MLKPIKTLLVGAVQYTISDEEKDVVTARYISSGSMAMRAGTICRGRAVGDTSNGFPGDYVIQYFDVDGVLAGEYDWRIEPVGDCFRLTWRARPGEARLPSQPGDLLYEGFGFPNSDRSIVVAYWFTESLSAAMEAKYAALSGAS